MIGSKLESRLVGARKNLPKGAKAVLEALQKAPGMLSARDLTGRREECHLVMQIYELLAVIQREGARSFGEGNFRALFEAIEREQTSSGWPAQ